MGNTFRSSQNIIAPKRIKGTAQYEIFKQKRKMN